MKLEKLLDVESCLDLTPVEVEVIGELLAEKRAYIIVLKGLSSIFS